MMASLHRSNATVCSSVQPTASSITFAVPRFFSISDLAIHIFEKVVQWLDGALKLRYVRSQPLQSAEEYLQFPSGGTRVHRSQADDTCRFMTYTVIVGNTNAPLVVCCEQNRISGKQFDAKLVAEHGEAFEYVEDSFILFVV